MSTDSSTIWNKTEILCLIKLVGEPFVNNNGEYSNEIFIEAASKLFEHGYQKTYIQCKNKWRELINDYNEFRKDEMGTEPLFYIELERILSKLQQYTEIYRRWTEPETLSLINVIKDGNYIQEIQEESNDTCFERIAKELENSGYKLRSKDEVKTRWQHLTSFYKSYIKGESLHFKYFNVMDKLLDWNSDNLDNNDIQDNISYDLEDYEVKSKETRRKSNNWSHRETLILLNVIKNSNYPKITRSQKNDMFDKASLQLRTEKYKRSSEQCKLKFKHLKAKYFSLLKEKEFVTNPNNYWPHFHILQEIMGESKTIETLDDENYEIEYLEDYENEILHKYTDVNNLEKNTWTVEETDAFLQILQEKDINCINNDEFFDEIAVQLLELGYNKSAFICLNKWQFLLKKYQFSIKKGINKNSDICEYFDRMNEIIGNLNNKEVFSLQNEDFSEDSEISFALKRVSQEEIPPKRLKTSDIDEDRLICNYKMDDIQHYCISLADTFKRLPNIKQAKLKIEIQKLLFKAEFDENF